MQIFVPLETETLVPEEVASITGRARRDQQIAWLTLNRWQFCTNAAGNPIVGRFYTRLKLAGVELSSVAQISGMPDFSKVR
jgi:hypothetical protein